MELIFLWLGINALIGYALGKPKNEVGASILVCICLGPIGWLLCILNKGNVRKCPYCAEDVKLEAVVCRHCGRDLSQVPSQRTSAAPNFTQTPQTGSNRTFFGRFGSARRNVAVRRDAQDPIPATHTSLSQLPEDTR
jgi:hypothetical protein